MTTEKTWKKFLALVPVVALNFMDQTILPVALPAIRNEMGASSTELQWSVNAYLLAIAIFVLVSGKLSDRIGHKKALIIGISGFVFFSTLCGLSQNIWMLIISRAFQGLSAAFMFPSQTAMIARIFPPEKRGKATGMIVSIGSLFFILGPLVGGYLTQAASWRWIFWINWPIGIVGLWLIYRFLPSSERAEGKIDFFGFCFFALGIGSLTSLLMQVAQWGWASSGSVILALLSCLSTVLLVYREKKARHPFLDLTLFKYPAYTAINISVSTIQFILMITVFRTLYFQQVLEYTPFQTGGIMFISSLPMLFMAPLAGFLSDRFGHIFPVFCGYVILIGSFFWFAFFDVPTLLELLVALLAFSVGVSFIFTPSYSSAIASVPSRKAGVAMGMIITLRMLSGTIGLALIHLFMALVEGYHLQDKGKRMAEIMSFSAVHFVLGSFLVVACIMTLTLHSKKWKYRSSKAPAEGWD